MAEDGFSSCCRPSGWFCGLSPGPRHGGPCQVGVGARTTCFGDRRPHRLWLVLLGHPLCLPWGKKSGSRARGKLGGNVCERGKDVAQEMAPLCLDSPAPRSHPGPQRYPECAFLEVLECGMPAPALLFCCLPFFFLISWRILAFTRANLQLSSSCSVGFPSQPDPLGQYEDFAASTCMCLVSPSSPIPTWKYPRSGSI